MKFCFCVAEYNPFHNGHLKHIEYMKTELGAEHVVVIMSGNFCQRGEPSVLNKYVRAEHAIKAGASAVIELPTVFAVSNAETFAKGAIKTASALGLEGGLCFGAESGTKDDYLKLARILSEESKELKAAIKRRLDAGESLAKAKCEAVKELYPEENFTELLFKPNNLLGAEYAKAVAANGYNLELFPMIREGDHNDPTLKKKITSASSIRSALKEGKYKKLKGVVPKYVFESLKNASFNFDDIIMSALIRAQAFDIEKLADCTEGLENRVKALSKDNLNLDLLIEKATTKRYPSSRIRRLLVANLLGITKKITEDALNDKLYVKILAINENHKDLVSLFAKSSSVPVLTRKTDVVNLKKTAEKCFQIDALANQLFNLATKEKQNEFQTIFVKP